MTSTMWLMLSLTVAADANPPKVLARIPLNPPLTCAQDSLFVFHRGLGRKDIRLADIEAAIPNGPFGASMQQMMTFCKTRGLEVHVIKETDRRVDVLPVPSILSVKGNHFIVLLGCCDSKIRFFDNSTGLIECDSKWFDDNMQWDGVALAEIDDGFIQSLAGRKYLVVTMLAGIIVITMMVHRSGQGLPAVSSRSARLAFTLVETLVVIAIVGLLMSISIPAAQRARAAAANMSCRDHLRQIGLAALNFESAQGIFPTNGGGPPTLIPDVNGVPFYPRESVTTVTTLCKPHAVGDPNLSPQLQGGSLFFTLLPNAGYPNIFFNRAWTEAVPLYSCPARRPPMARVPPPQDEYGEYVGGGWAWTQTDFAVNFKLVRGFGFYPRKMTEVTDGAANTILVGEKALNPKNYLTGTWIYDSPFFFGGTLGTDRGLSPSVVFDGPDFSYVERWGSCHPVGANFVFADGTVRSIAYQIKSDVVWSLTTPAAGD